MMYDIKTTEAVKDFATVVKIDNKIDNVKVTFEIIKCKEELTKEESDYLGIIRSDIYYLVRELFDKVIIVSDWSDHNIYGSYQTITEYGYEYSFEKVPVFFVIGCDYPFADQHIGTLCRYGFYSADHLVDLENNYVLVRTSLKRFDTMNKLHYTKVLEFESRRASDIEPVKTETESVTEQTEEAINKTIKGTPDIKYITNDRVGAKVYNLVEKCTVRDLVKFIRSCHTGYPIGNFKITDGVVDELFSDIFFWMWSNFTPISYAISRYTGSGTIRINTEEFRKYYDISDEDWITINKLMTPASRINEVIKKFYTNRLTKSEAIPYITATLNSRDRYSTIRKAIDDKKAEIVGISDEELEEAKFAPDLEVVNLWYKRMIDEDIDPKKYIEELEAAIENENLWIKGSRTDEEKYMHETNISTLDRTIELIRERISLKKCPVTVGMLKDTLKDLSDNMPVMFSLGINENGEIGYTTTDTVNVLHNPVNDELFVALDDSIKFALINPDKTPEEIIESTKFEVITKLI